MKITGGLDLFPFLSAFPFPEKNECHAAWSLFTSSALMRLFSLILYYCRCDLFDQNLQSTIEQAEKFVGAT